MSANLFNTSDNYFLSLLKNISWKLDNLFNSNDEDSIKSALIIDEDNAELLATTGHTKDSYDGRNKGMWYSYDNSDPEHYFTNVYKKLACCTNQSSITVPILSKKDGEMKRVYKTITIDL